MSDDEDAPMRGEKDPKQNELSSTSDDDSSSSSSGSSSSSDSSDSESDGEGQQSQRRGDGDDAHADDDASGRKYSIESVASSNGRARGAGSGEPLADVNSNRAAARFREQNSEVGLMALGTKKRDRRTIEEIQRDLQKKRGRSGMGLSLNGASASGSKPPVASSLGAAAAARASPPKGSPALSPEPAGSDSSQIATGLPQIKMPKGKPNSARSRLTMKILGRGRPNPVPAPKPAAAKKPSAGATASGAPSAGSGPGTASGGGGGGGGGIVTNISAGAKVTKLSSSSSNDLDSYVAEQKAAEQTRQLEPRIEPKVVEWKPDGKVVRTILRGMLRFGDLTEVQMHRASRESFADEYKLPNFVVRSNLPSLTKVPEERLLKTACEIAERAQKAIEDKQDNMKFVDVETKPSQLIERLYENLKLRVAVQRALRDARCSKSDDKGAYVLVAKQSDLPTLGISRDFPPWHWAEKEHDWTSKKDTALLLGIYLHGFGAWESILNDDLLHFHQQRALKGDRMKKRAENLLKRLPPPDEAGEPRIVQLANAMIASSLSANQSIGAQLSKIINNSGNSSTISSTSSSSTPNTGWLKRAEERHAARQNSSSTSTSAAPDAKVVAEDSIRRAHTQGGSSSSLERHRKPSIASSESASASSGAAATATRAVDVEPEEGEVGASRAASSKQPSSSSSNPSPSAASPSRPRSSAKRSPSAERTEERRSEPVKQKKSGKRRSAERSPRKPKKKPRLLSKKECAEKWEPSVLLKDIRQVLKKMKIMASWSKEQKDEVIVEKVYKYVATIGEAIDEIVRRAEEKDGKQPREWDELCSCLWAYAAGFTPFSATNFERLYDDICADGNALRQANPRSAAAST